jgi:hypothetical protein
LLIAQLLKNDAAPPFWLKNLVEFTEAEMIHSLPVRI